MTALPNSVKSRFHFSWILHLENMDIFYESALPPEMFSFGTKREPERTAVPGGHESPSGAFKPQTGLRSKCRVFSAARSQRFRRAGADGLRHPASASCLGRHSHPAGRCPNSSSLHPPLARCSHREPAAVDAVCRYDSSREKTKKKSPQAFLFLQIKNNFSAMIVRAKRRQF